MKKILIAMAVLALALSASAADTAADKAAKVKKDGKFGFIDTRNQVVIPI